MGLGLFGYQWYIAQSRWNDEEGGLPLKSSNSETVEIWTQLGFRIGQSSQIYIKLNLEWLKQANLNPKTSPQPD